MQAKNFRLNTSMPPAGIRRCVKRTSEQSRHGFTVIEMLVVLALSSMLLVGLMSIVKLFGTYHETLANEFPEKIWQARLQQQIRTDLINSREYRVSPDKLELIGYASKDFSSGESNLMPSNITYRIEDSISKQSYLIRSEAHYTSTGQVVWSNELMALGFAAIKFERTEDWHQLSSLKQYQQSSLSSNMQSRISDRMTLAFYAAENSVEHDAPRQQNWVIPIILR